MFVSLDGITGSAPSAIRRRSGPFDHEDDWAARTRYTYSDSCSSTADDAKLSKPVLERARRASHVPGLDSSVLDEFRKERCRPPAAAGIDAARPHTSTSI